MSTPLIVKLSIDNKDLNTGLAESGRQTTQFASTTGAAMSRVAGAGQVSAAQTAAAWRQLPAQFSDIVVQLQGGQGLGTVLLQQGSQIEGAFGGLGPMFSQLSTLVTPARVALVGAAAAVGAVAMAAVEGWRETAKFNTTMALTGNYAGVSSGAFTALARDVADSTKVSIGAARELALAAAATGSFGPTAIGPVTTAMATMVKVSGAAAQDVAADFASMTRNVTAWAVEHNRQYNFLTAAEYAQIKALQEHGRVEEAAAKTAEKLSAVMKARAPELGTLQKAWQSLGSAASWAWDKMMDIGRPATIESRIADAQAAVTAAEKNLAAVKKAPIAGDVGQFERVLAAARTRLALAQSDKRQLDLNNTNHAADLAAEAKKINDEASGKADSLANTAIDARLAAQRNASAARLAVVEAEQQQVDAVYRAGLASAQEYADSRVALIAREVGERAAQITREIADERSRPGTAPALLAQRNAKIIALEGQRAQALADGAKRVRAAQIEADQAALESARTRAQAWADAWTKAHDLVQSLQDANADKAIGLIQDPAAQERARTAQANALLQRKLSDNLVDIRNQRDIARGEGNADRADELQRRIDEMNQATADAVVLNNQDLAERLKPGWQKMVEGWGDANRLMREGWDNTMTGVLRNAEDAWVQLVTKGKLSFRTLVDDWLAEQARISFRSFIGSVGKGGGLDGLISAGFSLLTGTPNYNAIAGLEGARAGGGDVDAGGLYLVGEQGPELLRMGRSGGSVISNAALRAGVGGGMQLSFPTNIHIDARSDQAQVAQAVAQGMAATERRMWSALRTRGVVR